MRYLSLVHLFPILTLLLVTAPPINSEYSSSQQGATISNHGTMHGRINGEFDILFEYGAESAVLQPPWDAAGFHYGYMDGAYVQVVPPSPLGHTVPIRSGTRSVEIYKPASTDENYSQGFEKWGVGTTVYLSRWIYFPDIMPWNTNPKNFHRFSFGGFVWSFGPADMKNKYFFGLNLAQKGTYPPCSNEFVAEIRWWSSYGDDHYVYPEEDYTEFKYTGIYIPDYVGVWTHIQMGLKIANDTSGWGRIWLNKEGEASTLIYEKTGIITDPRGFSQWNTKAGYFLREDSPSVSFGLHKSRPNLPEAWIFLDDIVLATAKVPETYGVFDDAY